MMKAEFSATAEDVAAICGGVLAAGLPGREIRTVTSDSRDLGEASLFVPLRGERFDGHDYIAPLASEGKIAASLTMKDGFADIAGRNNVSLIACRDTLAALGRLGASRRERSRARIIGITGTNGKTTTKELAHHVLSSKYRVLKNEKNYNNEIGVPFALMGLDETHDLAVIEMGMNHAGEIDRLSRMARPGVSLITSVGEGHLEFLGSIENVARAKAEILNGMEPGSVLIMNNDAEHAGLIFDAAREKNITVKTFGLTPEADLYPESYRLTNNTVSLAYKGTNLEAPLYGIHNVYNMLGVLALALEAGMTAGETAEALAGFPGIDGRSQVIDRGYVVINDTYNSNPLSLRNGLESVREIFPEKRKFAVLADMKELGNLSESFHREAGRDVLKNQFDFLLAHGEMSRFTVEEARKGGMAPERALHFSDKEELSAFLKKQVQKNDVLLIKGSRSMRMEAIVEELTG